MRHVLFFLIFTIALFVTPCGCSSRACTLARNPGIVVLVRSGGQPLCDAVVTVSEGDFREDAESGLVGDCRYTAARDRPGTYAVDVRRAGFLSAQRTGVVAAKDDESECQVVKTTELTIDLEPDPIAAADAGSD